MLKNDRRTLPLVGSLRRVCLLGPLADAPGEMRGCWSSAGRPEDQISVLAGLRNALPPRTEILHSPGVAIDSADTHGIAAAVSLCDGADVIVLCLGEAAAMSGEAASRAHPQLPGQQLALAEAVFERAHAGHRPSEVASRQPVGSGSGSADAAGTASTAGIPVIVVLFSGRPLVVPRLAQKADALLAAWFLGCEAGNSIADVLTGRASPSGKTPMSWPRALGQVPIFFAERPTGRPAKTNDYFTSKYLDVPNDPLYPFGHGLSYGEFHYSNLRVTPGQISEDGMVEIKLDVANQGAHAAEETVFLFTHDKVASVARPLLELKGVAKVTLAPGEVKPVQLTLHAHDLRFLGRDLTPVFEAGEVEVLVGPSADRARLLVSTIRLEHTA